MTTYLAGFSLGMSLILVIGSQNSFVLKQGLKKQHVFIVCFVCALSDGILISLGVAGFGVFVERHPSIEIFARYGGAIFLFLYALLSFKDSITKNHALKLEKNSQKSVYKAVITCLAFTWLNPHVYLDTVILLGSVSTKYQPSQLNFALGAILASFIFFFSLGYGARLLAPIFKNPKAWKIFDFSIGFIMLTISYSLVNSP